MRYLLFLLLLIKVAFCYDVNILKNDIEIRNVTISDNISYEIRALSNNIDHYSFTGNNIDIYFDNEISQDILYIIEMVDDDAISYNPGESKKLTVSFPLLMTFVDQYQNLNEDTEELTKRADVPGFATCLSGYGIVLLQSCTWIAIVSGAASCVGGGLTAMIGAAVCAVAYGIDW